MTVTKLGPLALAQTWSRLPWLWDEDEEWMEAADGLTVYETDNDLIVQANVPGIESNEVDISIEGRTLTIKAEHKESQEKKQKRRVVYRQARQARYIYTTTMPCPVKVDKAKAELKNGVLVITLPKAEEAKPLKIAVKAKAK